MFWIKEKMYVYAALQQAKVYAHSKSIYYPSFMSWAFGDDWELESLRKLHKVWNKKHSNIFTISSPKRMSDVILTAVDWYIQIVKKQHDEMKDS